MQRALNADPHSLHPEPYWYVKRNGGVYSCNDTEIAAIEQCRAANERFQTDDFYVEMERTDA